MSRLNITGKVIGSNGKPIRGASIKIYDKDTGSSDDLILSDTTDNTGVFAKRSKPWRDNNSIPGPFGTRVPTPDIMLLTFKVKKNKQTHEGPFFLLPNGKSASIVCPWFDDEFFVSKSDREILLVSCVADYDKNDWEKLTDLYHWLDTAAPAITKTIVGPKYKKFHQLTGNDATFDNFIDKLASIGSSSAKAIDVSLNLHGYGDTDQSGDTSNAKLSFNDKKVKMQLLESKISNLNLRHKLRFLYSSACFGSSHNRAFLKGGFSVASGAKLVNTNGELSYPAFLQNWVSGKSYKKCIAAGNFSPFVGPHDDAAERLNLTQGYEADSFKVANGNTSIKIDTSPGGIPA